MISDPNNGRAETRIAVAEATHLLPAGDVTAHVFYEERSDIRMTLASSGFREMVVTRTRGAALSGRHSVHITDPQFIGPGPDDSLLRFQQREADELERAISEWGAVVGRGRRHPVWSARLASFRQEVWVGTPEGRVVSDSRGGCRVTIRVQVAENGSAQAVEEFIARPGVDSVVKESFARAFDRAEERESATVAVSPGLTTAVFAPGVAGIVVHELVGHALEGDVVASRPTWLQREPMPSPACPLNVVDDPLRGRGAWAIDDEGVEVVATLLVERGRQVGLLLDRASATALGRESTGHGRRSSYLESLRPRMGCTYVAPGIDDPEEVLRSTRSGVFIRRLAAGHIDPFGGRASFIVTDADRVVDGRLVEPLEDFIIELDGAHSWASIDRVASDLRFDTCIGSCIRDGQPLAVSVGAPTIRIGVVTVRV